MSKVIAYVRGVDRNNPDDVRSHLYAKTKAGNYWPMCDYGWNRSDGTRFSILRGWTSRRGECQVCAKRAETGEMPVMRARIHKTRWL